MISTACSRLGLRLALLAAIIVTGLVLRGFGYGLGLSFTVVKYGGSALWGAMVYVGVALAVTSACGRPRHALALSVGLATAVELSRLYHVPWLDDFRLTPAGALLLGRVFSPWNLVAYATGMIAVALLEWMGTNRPSQQTET